MSTPTTSRLGVRMGDECYCHRHRELVPMETHHVWPLGLGGPNADWNKVVVCENAHGSIHAYLDMLLRYHLAGLGRPAWDLRRRYGRKVRALAEKGLDAYLTSQAGR